MQIGDQKSIMVQVIVDGDDMLLLSAGSNR